MSDDTGDRVPSLLNYKNLTREFYLLVPNAFLIFSIALVLMLILYSDRSFEKKPHDIFCFNKKPDPKSKDTNPDCPPMETLDGTDIGKFGLVAFIFSNAYKVTLNATNSVIHKFLVNIQKLNFIRLYLFFFIIIKTTRELVKIFFPFNLFKKLKNKEASIIIDFMSIFMSVIALLFTMCILVAIVVYFGFIFYRLGTAKRYDTKLIPVLVMLILIFPVIAIVFGLNATITENGVGVKNKEKVGHYNWLFVLLIALGVPFIATCQTVGSVLISGFFNIFNDKYQDEDAVNQYPKLNKVGGGIEDVVKAVRAVKGLMGKKDKVEISSGESSFNPLTAHINSSESSPVNNNDFPPVKNNDLPPVKIVESFFITKSKKIRSNALWFIAILATFTVSLTIGDLAATTLKLEHTKKNINKTFKFLT
jgi:hypothetical protein